jgi:hypothetical protein
MFNNLKKYKIMTQMNELNATKLSMEELENVNGGILRRLRLKREQRRKSGQ